MTTFVAGATGVLGRRLVDDLTDRGGRVLGLVRDEAGAAAVGERGGEPRRGDVLDRDSLAAAVEGEDVDCVVHAATAIPTSRKPSAAEWERNDRVRVEGARTLLAVAESAGADRFVLESVVFLARRPDGSRFDEDAPPNPDPETESAVEAERLVRASDVPASVLRCGFLYAHDAAHVRGFAEGLLDGSLPVVGAGAFGRREPPLSFVHADDAARAFADAVEAERTGLWHVVDDEPTSAARFLRGLADRLGAPAPHRIPGWLARFLVGAATVRMMTAGMPTTNERIRAALGWEPAYPTVAAGLDAVVERWRDEGSLVERPDGDAWVG
ncbi:MAG: NAD-dependent epimerase/dehydratase family protein [Haloferacaceae archaeon]